jgi:hypothetical protein
MPRNTITQILRYFPIAHISRIKYEKICPSATSGHYINSKFFFHVFSVFGANIKFIKIGLMPCENKFMILLRFRINSHKSYRYIADLCQKISYGANINAHISAWDESGKLIRNEFKFTDIRTEPRALYRYIGKW